MINFDREILFVIIISIVSVILAFLIAVVFRRIRNGKKYEALDEYRALYRKKIAQDLKTGKGAGIAEELRARPLSVQWRALEQVLFEQLETGTCKKEIQQLFHKLGYKDYYENKLKSKRVIIRAGAVDKIGKMLGDSTAKLVDILKKEDKPEVLRVTIRALSRNSGLEGLRSVLERLPELYRRSLVSQKTIEASLSNFGADAVPLIVEYGSKGDDSRIRASLLEVLSNLPGTSVSLDFALANMSANDPEVRAKAIKVFARCDSYKDRLHPELLLPLLNDPVWFVRLQAAKAFGNLKYERYFEHLGDLLHDPNWQVRNAAAGALANIGDASLDVFLKILKYSDRYAKESICEEATRTNYTQRLIENLANPETITYKKSLDMLKIMHSLHFSTPLYEYAESGENNSIKKEISLVLQGLAHHTEE